MSYTHLTENERYQVFILLNAGLGKTAIAHPLGRDRSTLYRELKRNVVFVPSNPDYSPLRAHAMARHRVIARAHTKRIGAQTWDAVQEKLKPHYSPAQISGDRARGGLYPISHESICRRIWANKQQGGDL